MIALNVTKEQFQCILKMAAHPDAEMTAINFKLIPCDQTTNSTCGTIHTSVLDADYEYQEEAHTLLFSNEVKHGMYKFVSDNTLGAHLQEILGGLKCDEESAEVASTDTAAQGQNSTTSTTAETPTLQQSQMSGIAGFAKPVMITQK